MIGSVSLDIPLPQPTSRDALRAPIYRRTWTLHDLLAVLPTHPLHVLDVGAGRHPIVLRAQDEMVTVDFDDTANPDIAIDFTHDWPFTEPEFDLVYLSHVVEHLYPPDRDRLIRNVYTVTKPGGFVFIRIPHRSSVQATGWEHYTQYGMNAAMSLCHGYNPLLPMFRAVSVGVALSIDFTRDRSRKDAMLERVLNARFRLTDQFLSKAIGGLAEVQFLLQRLPEDTERSLRADTSSGHSNGRHGNVTLR